MPCSLWSHAWAISGAPHLDGVDEVQQDLALVVALHELHVLHDEVGGRPHAPNRQEDVVVQEVAGQPLNLLRADTEGLMHGRSDDITYGSSPI